MWIDADGWSARCRRNASILEAEIKRLKAGHGDDLGLRDFDYHGFWDHAREIIGLFKSLKLTAVDRERLWAWYSSTCAETRLAQQRDRKQTESDSQIKRDLVMSKIREAHSRSTATSSASDFAQADALLRQALGWMKNGWDGFNTATQLFSLSSGRMLQADRGECWTAWKETQELLQLRRDEFFTELRARLGARVERWRDFVASNNALIQTIEEEIERFQELEQRARTDEFANEMRERIEAKMRKIAQIQARNEELENRIASAERWLHR